MIKYGTSLQVISRVNAGMKRGGVAASPRQPLRATTTRLSTATRRGDSYGHRDGGRYPNPALAVGFVPSRGSPLVGEIRQNKGLLGTTHKPSLYNRFRSLRRYTVQPVGRPQNPDVGNKKDISPIHYDNRFH